MSDRTLAGGLALKGDWALGENGWKPDFDANLLKLSVVAGKKVVSRVSATPGAPTAGDVYIFKADHPTEANKIAAYDNGAWVYIDPVEGWELYSVADAAVYRYTAAGGWAAVTGGATTLDALTDVDTSTIAPTDGQVLKWNAAASLWEPANDATGSSGAAATATNWWGNTHRPTASLFTLVHGGAATDLSLTDDADVGLIIDTVDVAAGENTRFAIKAAPSDAADWSLVARFSPHCYLANYNGIGLVIYEAASTKSVFWGMMYNGGPFIYCRRQSAGTFIANVATYQPSPGFNYPYWVRIRFVQASLTYFFDVSLDGKAWINGVTSLAQGTAFTSRADNVGVGAYLNVGTAGKKALSSCDYFTAG